MPTVIHETGCYYPRRGLSEHLTCLLSPRREPLGLGMASLWWYQSNMPLRAGPGSVLVIVEAPAIGQEHSQCSGMNSCHL